MNKSKTIAAIINRHGAAFIGLTPEQRDALHNAMRAAWTAGNEARPDYDPPPALDGDTSEKLTPHAETLKHIFEQAGPVPDALDGFLHYLDRVNELKRQDADVEVVA